MGKKIIIVLLVGLALAVPLAHAQQPKQIPRIGYVSGTGDANNQGPYVEALRQGLRQFGYVEGKNYLIEYRGAEGNLKRVPTLVNEFVELKVDVIIAPFPPAIRAAKQATKTIPWWPVSIQWQPA
jgi:putative tryptophan/tyrosine transport system substrate-binding protein